MNLNSKNTQTTGTIELRIPIEKYNFLLKTVDSHVSFLHQIKLNPLLKQDLLKDLRIIRSILTTNKGA